MGITKFARSKPGKSGMSYIEQKELSSGEIAYYIRIGKKRKAARTIEEAKRIRREMIKEIALESGVEKVPRDEICNEQDEVHAAAIFYIILLLLISLAGLWMVTR